MNRLTSNYFANPWLPSMMMVLALLGCLTACKRAHYRERADAEAYELITEKANDPRWTPPDISIDIDPRSRMFDANDPDYPPMPPDDPTSNELMYRIDGKPNYPHWEKYGMTPYVENPDFMKQLPLDEDGLLRLDLATAIDLALIHSPDYQENFEDLYLSALDVSAERFDFDSQLFGGSQVFYRTSGEDSGRPRSRLNVDSDLALRKTFITGADLLVNFANTFVWDFHGQDTNAAFSLLDFSFVQPLLRGAGREVVLTRLTLSERNLLANLRSIERFRQGFYLEIATGDGGVRGPRRIGGLFGGSGLEGFTGVGGGFGGVGGVFTGAGGAFAAGAALQVGGFLGLLQDRQNIRNQRTNITGLRARTIGFQQTLNESLRQIPDDPTVVVQNRLQVAQTRQTLFDQEFALSSAEAAYQAQVDGLKIRLGLPPHIGVVVEDPLLDRFNLLDTAIVPLQDEVSDLSDVVGAINELILESVSYQETDGRRVASLAWTEDLSQRLQQLLVSVERIKNLRDRLSSENMAQARRDIDQLERALPRRRATLERLRRKYPTVINEQIELAIQQQTRIPVDIDPAILSSSRLDTIADELNQEYQRLQTRFQTYEQPIQALQEKLQRILARADLPEGADLYNQLESEVIFEIPRLLAELNSDLLDLSLIQARARTESIDLILVDLNTSDALGIASQNRLDWMNARAGLVDTWRAIWFVADQLEGVLDIVADGDIGTEGGSLGNNPFKFRSTTGSVRMGVRFDAPFTRLLERNTYRQVLIDYQQSRRSYYRFIDGVSSGLREAIRTLELNELNFEIRRVAILSAIEQVVLNDEISTLNEERGAAQGATAARDIVQALSDLQNAQDAFTGVWITYEVNRRFLDFNLGTFQLDRRGLWIDPGPIKGGVAPYVVGNSADEGNPMLSPDDEMWLESEGMEALPPASPAPTNAYGNTESKIRMFRLPNPADAG